MAGLSTVLCIFSFWVPLLASFRASGDNNDLARQFLVTYWVFYAILTHVWYFVYDHLEGLKLGSFVAPLGALFNIWMFYHHGCLVIAQHYVPVLFGRTTGYLSVAEFDHRVLTPLMAPVANSVGLFSQMTGILHSGSKSRRSSDASRRSLNSSRRPSDQPRSAGRVSFLEAVLARWCYMDDPNDLRARYMRNQRLFWDISQAFSSPQRNLRVRDPSVLSPDGLRPQYVVPEAARLVQRQKATSPLPMPKQRDQRGMTAREMARDYSLPIPRNRSAQSLREVGLASGYTVVDSSGFSPVYMGYNGYSQSSGPRENLSTGQSGYNEESSPVQGFTYDGAPNVFTAVPNYGSSQTGRLSRESSVRRKDAGRTRDGSGSSVRHVSPKESRRNVSHDLDQLGSATPPDGFCYLNVGDRWVRTRSMSAGEADRPRFSTLSPRH